MIKVRVNTDELEPSDATVLGDLMLPKRLPLNDEVDRYPYCGLEHEQLPPRNLRKQRSTESSKEMSLDFR